MCLETGGPLYGGDPPNTRPGPLPFTPKLPAKCTGEAVLNCLFPAHTATGWDGKAVYVLTDLWKPTG